MDTAEHEQIVKRLRELAKAACPRCGEHDFVVLPHYVNLPVQENENEFNIGGKCLPAIVSVCSKCGFVAHHALGMFRALKHPADAKRADSPEAAAAAPPAPAEVK